jgi:hypothetical protein
MHYFLIIYFLSTSNVLISEFSSLKECKQAKNIMSKELKYNEDVNKIICEKGFILDEGEFLGQE